jgi:chorismate lyase/3-hydroxybenzoate synthase
MSLPLRPLPACPARGDRSALPETVGSGPVWKALRPADSPSPVAGECLLGAIGYDSVPPGFGEGPIPAAAISMPVLGTLPLAESWHGCGSAEYAEADGIRYATNGEVLFGVLCLPSTVIDSAAYEGYRRIIGLARGVGYPNPVRLWNYFPGINEGVLGLERYKRFCLGRYQAFSDAGYTFGEDLPAASAIGTGSGDLWIVFLAARGPARQIENPRQVSAYRYPLRYGPRSPSFSRAMRLDTQDGSALFISGTASIVGHETVHVGDVAGQCAETLENIRAILAQAGMEDPADLAQRSSWKVYIRHPADYPRVRDILDRELGPEGSLLFLKGDICRRDLLLEIEGEVSLPGTPGRR